MAARSTRCSAVSACCRTARSRRALIFVALAWGVPFLLSLAEGNLLYAAGKPFLLDLGAWARFFIAVGAFILAAAGMTKLPYKELFAIVKKK